MHAPRVMAIKKGGVIKKLITAAREDFRNLQKIPLQHHPMSIESIQLITDNVLFGMQSG